MPWRVWRDRLRALAFGDRVREEIRAELEFHRDMRTAQFEREGLSPSEAAQAAERRLGSCLRHQQEGYDVKGGGLPEEILTDARYALRTFRTIPGWTAAIVATFAVGVGAATAIFTTARSVLLKPLPYAEPDRLVMMWIGDRVNVDPPGTDPRGIVTDMHLDQWRRRNTSLADIAFAEQWRAQSEIGGTDEPERLRVSFASTNFFDVLGVKAALGRTFTADDRGNPPEAIVLSDQLWRRRFHADPGIIGRTVALPISRATASRTMLTLTVVGVLPPNVHYTYPQSTDAWLPRSWAELNAQPGALRFQAIARLKPGVTFDQAQADMNIVNDAIAQDDALPNDGGSFRNRVSRAAITLEKVEDWALGQTRPTFLLLAIASVILLLVACVNLVSLLLARTVRRTRELALRAALGASPRRLHRQLMTEWGVIAAAGAVAGAVTAAWLQSVVRASLPASFPRLDEIGIDSWSLVCAAGVSAVMALLAGLLEARLRSHSLSHQVLKQSGFTGTGDRRASRHRRVLTAAQVAAVVCLMITSVLLLRTLWNLQRVDLGFDGREVLVVEVRQFDSRYSNGPRRYAFLQDLLARVRALPGVVQAGSTNTVPLRNRPDGDTVVRMPTPAGPRVWVHQRTADPDYFGVLRIPVLTGRLYEAGEAGVAVLSASAVRAFFNGQNPIGRTLSGGPLGGFEIVGVVQDVRNLRVDESGTPAYYVPFRQNGAFSSASLCLVVRTDASAGNVPAAIRGIIRELDPSQPIEEVTTMDGIVAASFSDRRFLAVMTVSFSLASLLLSLGGVYSVVSHGVAERIRELGIRIALGAGRYRVVELVLRQAIVPVALGVTLGCLGAAWLSRLVQSHLFGISTLDPLTYLIVPIVLIVTAAVACLVPAYRAVSINPNETLRAE